MFRQVKFVKKKGLVLLLPFLLFFSLSSCTSTCRDWECAESISCAPSSHAISYKRMIDPYHQIEIIRWDGQQQVFLNLLMCPIDAPAESTIIFHYTIQGQNYAGKAILLEGGQRLLLRSIDGDRMIEAWSLQENVSISI